MRKHTGAYGKSAAVLTALLLTAAAVSGSLPGASAHEQVVPVYAISLPRSADPNYGNLNWGHRQMTFQFGWGMKENVPANHRFFDVFSLDGYFGKIAYCVEPGIQGAASLTMDEGYFDNYPQELNPLITREERKLLLSTLLYHGYRGNVSTSWSTVTNRSEISKAAATQYLVHEIIVGERDGSFNHLVPPPGSSFDRVLDQLSSDNPLSAPVLAAYNDIEATVRADLAVPSFMSLETPYPSYRMGYDGTSFEVHLIDSNNSLAGYTFSCSVPSVTFRVSGNTLRVTSPEPVSGLVITAKKTFPTMQLVAYSDGHAGYQDLLTYGTEVNYTLELKMNLTVEGLVGIRKLGNLLSGSHETGEAAGIIVATDYTLSSVPGAVYELRAAEDFKNSDGAVMLQKGQVTDRITTVAGVPGYAYSTPQLAGNYELVEITAPVGFTINPKPIPVTVTATGTDAQELKMDLIDDPQRIRFSLTKTFDTKQGASPNLSDVRFSLYSADSVYPVVSGVTPDTKVFETNQLIEVIGVSGTGLATIQSNLPAGKYYLVETQSPANYRKIERFDFEVTYTGRDQNTELFNVELGEFVNAQMTASLGLRKSFEGTDIIPGGINFLLTYPDASTLTLPLDTTTGKIFVDGLPLGTYTLEELPSAGNEPYILMAPVTFNLVEDTQFYGMEVSNALIRGNVRLLKKSEQSGKTLAGAVFELRSPKGVLLGAYTTDKDGVIAVEDLPFGKGYTFTETVAPQGFALLAKPISFDVTENAVTIELTALNKADVITGDGSGMSMWLAVLSVSMGAALTCAVIIMEKSRRRRII